MEPNLNLYEGKAYALTRNIMLTVIVVLFFLIVLMICLHFYARWYLRRARLRLRDRRRAHFVFFVDSDSDAPSRGLDASVIHSLPVFRYSSNTHPNSECAVCLSEFEENEAGRVLPKCKHTFHVECIDMWFQSHSTCPLCRSLVEPADQPGSEVMIDVCNPGSSSNGGEDQEENRTAPTLYTSSSSIGMRRKTSLVGVKVEVPKSRSFGREMNVSGFGSPSNQSPFRSPRSRILSFKRILSRDRKGSISPSSGGAGTEEGDRVLETSQ